jgi:FAD/FMN-containing dehydrogenase
MRRRAFFQSAVAAAAALSVAPHPALAAAARLSRPPLSRTRLHDIDAVTGDGRTVTIPASAVAELRARMRGPVLLAGDGGYDDARLILNPSFNRHPALIAQATGPADVMAAVDFARDHGGVLLAVKCGGHSYSGLSTCDRGMMIDLSRFRHVGVDPAAQKARVAGGTLLGQVDHETLAHGLATTMGTVSHTGAGGLITGGGFGRLGRRFGLSIDNLTAVQVVTANGRLVRASADENEDLFWGVRGGGGNFGVVTSFELQLHPMRRQVMAGSIVYPIARARDALSVLAEQQTLIPDEMALDFFMVQPPGGEPGVFAFEVFYSGAPERLDALLAPIRRLGAPLADEVAPRDYVLVQRSGDVSDPRAQGMYLKGGFVPDFTPALIDAIVDGFRGDPTRATAVFAQTGGGAIARVASDATAFSQRDARANLLSFVGWRFGEEAGHHIDWLRSYWSGLERFTYGFYVNDLLPDHSAAAIQANYRANHDRLVAVKDTYDPTNLFRLNANIRPTPQARGG